MERIEFTSKHPSETISIGEHIGKGALVGDLFLLTGELGAGKTQLVKGLAKGIGVEEWRYVLSPSFTLMNIYEGRGKDLCHVDLYRLDETDVESLDIEEFLGRGIVAVEWAERFTSWQNPMRIFVQVAGEDIRTIVMEVEDAGRAEVWRHFGGRS